MDTKSGLDEHQDHRFRGQNALLGSGSLPATVSPCRLARCCSVTGVSPCNDELRG
jgi:hypothetical protein